MHQNLKKLKDQQIVLAGFNSPSQIQNENRREAFLVPDYSKEFSLKKEEKIGLKLLVEKNSLPNISFLQAIKN